MGNEETSRSQSVAGRTASRHLTIVRARQRRIALMAVSLCLCVVLVAAVATGIFLLLRKPTDNGRILENVTVGGINIGGMTPDDARYALQLTIGADITNKDMMVALEYDTLVISAEEARIRLDIDALVEAAYSYGRTGSTLQQNLTRAQSKNRGYAIALLPYMEMDLEYIRDTVDRFCAGYTTDMVHPTVTLNGLRPQYQGAGAAVVHQTMTITMGSPKSALDPTALYYEILDAYSLYDLEFDYELPILVEPPKPTAQEIFDEYCVYPQDATIDNKTFAVTPEVYGYGFNVELLQRLLDRAGYRETVEITLDFILPDITASDLSGGLFKDTLAVYTSHCNDGTNANRDKNLQLSCEAINGYVLKVGETLDFDQLLGPRTTNRGYRSAPTYSGSTTSTVGGGISQTASALYYCALLAGLQIDEHHFHRYAVPYTPLGTDASITYGSESLVFTNNTSAPIRIVAEANGSTVKITFQGTEDKQFLYSLESETIEQTAPNTIYQSMTKDNAFDYRDGQVLQVGLTGYIVETYLCKYDPETGALVSRELLSQVSYEKRDQIVVRIESGDNP